MNILLESLNRVLLQENSIDRKVNNLISSKLGITDFNAIRRIRAEFLIKMPNARAQNERWLCKILEWYLDGYIKGVDIINVNYFLRYMHDNFPRRMNMPPFITDPKLEEPDFGGMSFDEFHSIYSPYFSSDIYKDENDKNIKTKKIQYVNGFEIRRVDSQSEGDLYGDTEYNYEWCILENDYDTQVDGCTCYIVKNTKTYDKAKPSSWMDIEEMLFEMGKDNIWDHIKSECITSNKEYKNTDYSQRPIVYAEPARILTDTCEDFFNLSSISNGLPPYDEYGLSAFVVLVYNDNLYGVYSRYNLPNMKDGALFNENELKKYLGVENLWEYFPTIEKKDM